MARVPDTIIGPDEWARTPNGRLRPHDNEPVTVGTAYSESLPTVRIFHTDDGTTKAVRGDRLVDERSGNDKAVWQSAIDDLHADWNPNDDLAQQGEIVGVIDGNGEEYSIGGSVTVKSGVAMRHARFNADAGITGVDTVAPSGYTFIQGVELHDIMVDGGYRGFRIQDLVHGTLSHCKAVSQADRGIHVQSCLQTTFRECSARQTGGSATNEYGLHVTNGGTSSNVDPNQNLFVNCRTRKASAVGTRVDGVAKGNVFVSHTSQGNTSHGVSLRGTLNTFDGAWVEGNGGRGIIVNGGNKNTLVGTRGFDNDGGGGGGRGIFVYSGARNHVDGFDGNDVVYVGGNSTRTMVDNVAPAELTDGGTRSIINGWGENAGDPSAGGQWNTNGEEGDAVVDTTNSVKYVYRGGAWV